MYNKKRFKTQTEPDIETETRRQILRKRREKVGQDNKR